LKRRRYERDREKDFGWPWRCVGRKRNSQLTVRQYLRVEIDNLDNVDPFLESMIAIAGLPLAEQLLNIAFCVEYRNNCERFSIDAVDDQI
jgi:hypothetical protein